MKETIYLLTGATGFLGVNVAKSLVAQGKKVRALVSDGDPALARIPPEVELTRGSLLNSASLNEFFIVPDGCEAIVLHLASFVTVVPEWNQKVYDVNVIGTENILVKCLKYHVKKLVYVSSTGAIPEPRKGRAIKEADSFEPGAVVGCFAQTKAEATQLVMDAAQYKGLDASIVYPSGVCGPGDFEYAFFTRFVVNCALGNIPAGIDGKFNPVDVRDVADGIIACAKKGGKGEGYIMSNNPVSFRDVFALMHQFTGIPEIKRVLPIPLAKFFIFFAKHVGRISGKLAELAGFMIYSLSRNNNFDCSKAVRELGFQCRPFEETVQDTVEWLRAEGKILVQSETNTEKMAA